MQAIVYHRYGSPDVLELAEIPIPTPAEGQVLIRVHAASVNPYDWHFLRGTPSPIRLFSGMRSPKSPRLGADVAGVVEAVGAKVAPFKPGDAVFGTAKGSFAEYACATPSQLAMKPQEISFEQAACLPIAGITALQGVRDKGKVQPGQTVLINGAAGGVGTFAVQIAKSLGTRVTGVCSTRNVELLRSIGADEVIDYTREDFARSTQHYDLLFDLVGNRPLADYLCAVQPHGTYIWCGGGGPDRSTMNLLARVASERGSVAFCQPENARPARQNQSRRFGHSRRPRPKRHSDSSCRPYLFFARNCRGCPLRRVRPRSRQSRDQNAG